MKKTGKIVGIVGGLIATAIIAPKAIDVAQEESLKRQKKGILNEFKDGQDVILREGSYLLSTIMDKKLIKLRLSEIREITDTHIELVIDGEYEGETMYQKHIYLEMHNSYKVLNHEIEYVNADIKDRTVTLHVQKIK